MPPRGRNIKSFVKHTLHSIKKFIVVLFKFHDVQLAMCSDIRNFGSIPRTTKFSHHGFGVVIGGSVKIGNNVRIHQNVTLGSRLSMHSSEKKPGPPIIEDNVEIFTNASVLGGVTIGRDAVIGAHSMVLNDIPPHAIAYGVPAKVKRFKK